MGEREKRDKEPLTCVIEKEEWRRGIWGAHYYTQEERHLPTRGPQTL